MSVHVGQLVPDWVVEEVSTEKMKTLAPILADSNPIHFDVEVVRALGMGDRPVNQGPTNLGYVMNMVAAWAGGLQHLREVAVRFQANVLGGDRVVARGVVTAVRQVDGQTLADLEVELVSAERVALKGTATVDVTEMKEEAR